MRELTVRETYNIYGGWGLAGGGVGALTGASGYLGRAATSGEFSWGGLAEATFMGGVLGAISGPAGAVRAYFMPRVGGGLGAVFGLFSQH
ncbi:MAG: hypothetical protein OXE40_10940 [Gammaproteobacteria bacterium]|nr:hypothetical protein [Gammaproteobacteria bacterium]